MWGICSSVFLSSLRISSHRTWLQLFANHLLTLLWFHWTWWVTFFFLAAFKIILDFHIFSVVTFLDRLSLCLSFSEFVELPRDVASVFCQIWKVFGKYFLNSFLSLSLSLFLCWHYIYVNMRNGASHFLRLFIFLHFFPTLFFRLRNLYWPFFKFANSANSNLLISPSNKFFIWFWYFSTFQFPLSKKSPCLY